MTAGVKVEIRSFPSGEALDGKLLLPASVSIVVLVMSPMAQCSGFHLSVQADEQGNIHQRGQE